MSLRMEVIEEHAVPGKRLGRHIEHDERSRAFAYDRIISDSELITTVHRRYGGIFDQGDLGSCTGNAMAGAKNTVPVHVRGQHTLHEQDAVDLYELATAIDEFPGQYPPDDTGSSGLAVAKAAQQKGYISSYQHAFSLEAALSAIQAGPVLVGANWYEGFDNPDSEGIVEISGQVRGGHEFVARGYHREHNPEDSLIVCDNSWNVTYGQHGHFFFTVKTLEQLLAEDGDMTILVP